ncbi:MULTISPECIES: adenylate/guanylate cyclase domain-containing protein [unclassified Leisingera]|uniref:adenylate/guanylate cyclase domain-containing protein n=1 Tax=unclassified Leisingera TaxID=2614906 RepID=UPI00057FA010|nr:MULTISPECIES: adenylate/guanylate cyclase domain-containing protein [unclassified Leisingera]KIC16183.1 adenylate/guanylate cyclase [Leisingera sp. ANG-DT]KIC30229.1 adenylate/guanylate cyclase [Leisingera sp. ANG-M6]KIC31921.1 adenylate/guanylate cyclase [Leisingera sp. ANG-S5]
MTDATDLILGLRPDRRDAALRLINYMLGEGRSAADPDQVLAQMCSLIRAAGLPLQRAASIVQLLHAEAVASARFWEHGKGTRSELFPFNEDSGDGYARSPAADVHSTGEWVVLWLPDTPDERYGIVPDLKAEGYTHYIMAPVFMAIGTAGIFSFATQSLQGFSEDDLLFLRAVFPALAACQEVLATARAMQEVLRIYVGEEPQRRILSGDVHRGEVMRIRSAILFADMRRFTELTASMSAEEATGLLNAYYDCIVPPVEAAGGEVLKLIGDGILAVFRAGEDGAQTCIQALAAAREGLARVAARSDPPQFEVGAALHFGEVAFGNVGSGMRLDYTVIGRDVNLAARVAELCGAKDERLLVSSEFRERAGLEGRSLGEQRLKGLQAPEEVFAVALE